MEFKQLHKKALYCMYVSTFITTLITLAVLTAILHFTSLFSKPFVPIAFVIILALSTINCLISPFFRYRRYRYAIDEECIYIREGFLWITETIVPLERLHKIAMSQGPIDRFFGLTKVVVTTAGGDADISFLGYETGQSITDSLKKKINTIALEENYGE
ncbi:PH domain-containing protein [Roseburia sp. 499]|uniref:PH domain-containing protein n=1 Tax=Roseburia sp. 499 TaxID=1261634 RepID=UPI0009513C62|nr:PH domain-containing protein [Roseburia sp. 499]WVK69664.1 PH domain-containing protein [Roseburia sp. 499]